MQASVAKDATTLGWLMAITFADGSVRRFNSFGAAAFPFGGHDYAGWPGFQISNLRETSGSEPPTVDIDRGLSGQGLITFTEAVTGLMSGRPVELIVVDFVSGASHVPASKWRIGQVTTTREGNASFELVSLERRDRQLMLSTFEPGCQHRFGDSGCGVNLVPLTADVVVVSSADANTVVISGATQADDYYNLGAIKFTSGQNAGLAYDIRDWTLSTGMLKLFSPLKRPLAAGDAAQLRPGCDKSEGAAGCGRYNNLTRRLGFSDLPDDKISIPAVEQTPDTDQSSTGWGGGYGGGGSWG
jgi:uncharacterized phage protein (TIGR02218 family)